MSNRLKSILTIADILLGVALIVLGLYRLIKVKITTPRVLFLSLYYLIFGTFLILSITPYEKFKIWINFMIEPIPKALFLLFLAALTFDIFTPIYLLYSISFICSAIGQTIYFVLFHDTDPQSNKNLSNEVLTKNDGSPHFGKVELDSFKKEDPKPLFLARLK